MKAHVGRVFCEKSNVRMWGAPICRVWKERLQRQRQMRGNVSRKREVNSVKCRREVK